MANELEAVKEVPDSAGGHRPGRPPLRAGRTVAAASLELGVSYRQAKRVYRRYKYSHSSSR